MKDFTAKIKKSMAVMTLKYILSSGYFAFFSAAVIIVCSYLALDIVMIWYMAAVCIAMLLLEDDLTTFAAHLIFFNVMVSAENSPSLAASASEYFFSPVIYIQIAVLAVFVVAAFVYRFVNTFRQGRFKPNGIFWGLCVLSLTFLLNGAGSSLYDPLDICYGAVLAFCFLGMYVLIASNVKINAVNFKKIAFAFLALSVLLVVELAVRYVQIIPELKSFIAGELEYNRFKEYICFGWGIWNTAGMLFCICIPLVFLLATRYEHGWLLTLFASLLALCAVLTWSRQAIVGVVVAYPASAIVCIVKGKRKPLIIASVCAVVLIAAVAALSRLDLIKALVGGMSDSIVDDSGEFTGNGRVALITAALEFFKADPVCGAGFFMPLQDTVFNNLSMMPVPACNTIAEIIGACGILGIAAYCVHRVQTVVAFFRHPSADKCFTGLAVLALLAVSLLDNHIFYIAPTIVYTALLVYTCEN